MQHPYQRVLHRRGPCLLTFPHHDPLPNHRAPLLRLIGPQKEAIGPKPLEEALRMAMNEDMDLILINPEQAPPVARIIQWSK
jgi:hypothetical protein